MIKYKVGLSFPHNGHILWESHKCLFAHYGMAVEKANQFAIKDQEFYKRSIALDPILQMVEAPENQYYEP